MSLLSRKLVVNPRKAQNETPTLKGLKAIHWPRSNHGGASKTGTARAKSRASHKPTSRQTENTALGTKALKHGPTCACSHEHDTSRVLSTLTSGFDQVDKVFCDCYPSFGLLQCWFMVHSIVYNHISAHRIHMARIPTTCVLLATQRCGRSGGCPCSWLAVPAGSSGGWLCSLSAVPAAGVAASARGWLFWLCVPAAAVAGSDHCLLFRQQRWLPLLVAGCSGCMFRPQRWLPLPTGCCSGSRGGCLCPLTAVPAASVAAPAH